MSLNDYRDLLHGEMRRRQITNPQYSLRAFARSLGLSAGYLALLLKGRKTLSVDRAADLARRIGLSQEQAREWIDLVQLSSLKSPQARKLVTQLRVRSPVEADLSPEFVTLQLDAFQAISDWYHYAILELTQTRGFDSTDRAIAARLGISVAQAREAISRLIRLGLLRRKRGRLSKTQVYLAVPSGGPCQEIRNFHLQMIERGREAIESQDVSQRDITGITIPIDSGRMDELRAEIRRFRRRVAKLVDSHRPDEVYQLNIQLFRLTQTKKEEPSV